MHGVPQSGALFLLGQNLTLVCHDVFCLVLLFGVAVPPVCLGPSENPLLLISVHVVVYRVAGTEGPEMFVIRPG